MLKLLTKIKNTSKNYNLVKIILQTKKTLLKIIYPCYNSHNQNFAYLNKFWLQYNLLLISLKGKRYSYLRRSKIKKIVLI